MGKLILDDETKRNLQYIAAKHFYKDASISEVKKIVDELTQANIWHDGFISIMDSDKSDRTDDVVKIFINAVKTLEIDSPENKEQAFWHICRYHISLMANNINPLRNIEQLINYFWWDGLENLEYYGSHYKIDAFLSIYVALDDISNFDVESEALTIEAIAAAKEWLANIEVKPGYAY